ncbi:MAG: SAM-dependent methyltransferase, partial [Chitinophagales bacterium]
MLDAHFWNQRYVNQATGWDLGQVSPPLQIFFEQMQNKDVRILIPGCGNA